MRRWFINKLLRHTVPENAPPLIGPDRNPSLVEYFTQPNLKFYDPNSMHFPRTTIPTVPDGPGGPQNFNADCARQPETMWNRRNDGSCVKEFFRRVMSQTGLEHM